MIEPLNTSTLGPVKFDTVRQNRKQEIIEMLIRFVEAGNNACIGKTEFIPIHKNTVADIVKFLTEGSKS